MVNRGELIHYIAVGRADLTKPDKSEILAHLFTPHGENKASVYQENAQKIMKKAPKLGDGKRIRLTSENEYEIHVMCESANSASSLIFITVTDVQFGVHHNIPTFAEEFKTTLTKAIPRSEWASSKGNMKKRLDSVLTAIVKKYNTSGLLEASNQIDDIKNIMTENVDVALAHSERLQDLDIKSSDLEQSSEQFYKGAKGVKCRLLEDHLKLLIILAVVSFVIVTIIVVGLTSPGGE